MSQRIQNKKKTRKSRGLEVNAERLRILRAVNDQEAFYFYENIGKPLGESAKSLSDLLEKVKSVKLESLVFHLQRKDFQNWIKKTIGDTKLATRLGKIAPSHDNEFRAKICATVENRIKELRGAPLTLLVDEGLAVTRSNSKS